MKHTKRLLAAVMALTMVSAIAPMSAFAEDTTINQSSDPKTGTMTATYDVSAKYTITIPTGVTLSDTATASRSIKASGVVLESGQKITVKLTGASNTESGSTFSAKNDKGDSTATYTIGKGEATTGISVGDTVAEFTADGSVTLNFSEPTGATHAGTHTEKLTFNIAVEDAVTTKTLTFTSTYFDINTFSDVTKSIEIEYTDNDTWKDIAERYDEVSLKANAYGPSEGKIVYFWYACQLKSTESSYNYSLVSINDKVSAYSSYYLQ